MLQHWHLEIEERRAAPVDIEAFRDLVEWYFLDEDHPGMSPPLDCAVDTAARVAGNGEVALNSLIISQNSAADARCDQTLWCELDDPLPPWQGAITGTAELYTYTTDVCFTSPWGTFVGPLVGAVTDVSSAGVGQSPTLTYTDATLHNISGGPDASLTATFDIDPDTVYITVP